jgi:hypothetical protein
MTQDDFNDMLAEALSQHLSIEAKQVDWGGSTIDLTIYFKGHLICWESFTINKN